MIDKRGGMAAVGSLDTFVRYQAANALEKSAGRRRRRRRRGQHGRGAGLGLGAGMAGVSIAVAVLPIASVLYEGPRMLSRMTAEVQSLLRAFSAILLIEGASLAATYY